MLQKPKPLYFNELQPGVWYRFAPFSGFCAHLVVDQKIVLQANSLNVFVLSNEIHVTKVNFDRVGMVKCIVGEQVGFLVVMTPLEVGEALGPIGNFYQMDE